MLLIYLSYWLSQSMKCAKLSEHFSEYAKHLCTFPDLVYSNTNIQINNVSITFFSEWGHSGGACKLFIMKEYIFFLFLVYTQANMKYCQHCHKFVEGSEYVSHKAKHEEEKYITVTCEKCGEVRLQLSCLFSYIGSLKNAGFIYWC